ncbi:hypothetical protein LINPERPRIM_LOCUS6324 [Linum perenne]
MATTEVEHIVEPLPISEVEGVDKRYLRAEVEADMVKSTEIQPQHYPSEQETSAFPEKPISEDDIFFESSSNQVNDQFLVGIEKISTPEAKGSEAELTTKNHTTEEVVVVPEKETGMQNPAQSVVFHETESKDATEERLVEEGKPEIVLKEEEEEEEEIQAEDSGVHQEMNETSESAEAATSNYKAAADDITEAVPVDNILPQVDMQTKQVPNAPQPDLETKSNTDATEEALDTAVSSEDRSTDIVKQEVQNEPQTTSVGEAAVETVKVPRDAETPVEISKEERSLEDDAVDVKPQDHVKEGTLQDLKLDDQNPDEKLHTYPDGEKEGLESCSLAPPTEETNELSKGEEQMQEEQKTEGTAVHHGETVEVPEDKFEDAETVEKVTTHETDEKPGVEISKDMDIITPPEDKKEETEDIKETVDEPAPGLEAAQDHESSLTNAQSSLQTDNMAVESNQCNKEASMAANVAEEAQQLVIPASSSGKLEDVNQEKVEIPKEDSKEDSFEPNPVEEILQKDEENAELSNTKSETAGEVESSIPRETEQNDEVVNVRVPSDEAETITETETETEASMEEKTQHESSSSITSAEDLNYESKSGATENDESTQKQTSECQEDKEIDFPKNDVEEIFEQSSVAQTEGVSVNENTEEETLSKEINAAADSVENVLPQKEDESGTSQENPKEIVTEREIVNEGDKAAVVQKEEAPEIIEAAKEADESEATKGIDVEESENMDEPMLGKEEDKESVSEEKALVEAEGGASIDDLKPETEQATNVTKEVQDEVAEGDVDKETKATEELNPKSEDCTEEMDEITKPDVITEEAEKKDSSDIKEIERVDQAEDAEEALMKETVVEEDERLNTLTVREVSEDTNLEEAKIEDKKTDKPDVKSNTTEAQASQEDEPALSEPNAEQNKKQQHSDTVCESANPEEDKLEAAVIEEEVKESPGVDVVPESSELHSEEGDYETKAVTENTEEKTRDVFVSKHEEPEDPLELHTTEEISLTEVEPKELEVDAKEEGASVEDEIKQASESLQVAEVDKATKDESVNEEKSEAQYEAQPCALLPELQGLTKTEEMKELLETELEAEREPSLQVEKGEVSKVESEAAYVTESQSPEDGFKEEIPVSNEMERYQDASDSTLETVSYQALPKEEDKTEEKAYPESQLEGMQLGDSVITESMDKAAEVPQVVQDTPKQTQGECNPEEHLQELKVPQLDQEVDKEIQDEFVVPSAVIEEEARKIPESVFYASESKLEENKVGPPEEEKRDDISVPEAETTIASKETSEAVVETENKPKQAEESPAQQEEELNVTQVENYVQESGTVEKGDGAAETDQLTKEEVSESLPTPDCPDLKEEKIMASDEMNRNQEAPDSTLKTISESNEAVLGVQQQHIDSDTTENEDKKTAEEPEVVEDTKTQTEGECKLEEGFQEVNVPRLDPEAEEAQGKQVQDEVTVPSDDIKEEVREIPVPAAEEIFEQIPQVEPEVENDVQGRENLHNGDAAAETTAEIPQQVSESMSASDSPAPTAIAGEQDSRDYQISELEPQVEKSRLESEDANQTDSVAASAITEETKQVSQVVTKSDSQENEDPGNENNSLQSVPVEKPEGQSHQIPEIKPEESATRESMLVKEVEVEPKTSEEESLLKKEPEVESNFEFQGFKVAKEDEGNSDQPQPEVKTEQGADVPPVVQLLEQLVNAEFSTEKEANKEAAMPSEKSSDITTETANVTSDSASEVSHQQEVITKPEDTVVNETQQEESTAEQVIVEDKKIIQASGVVNEIKESQPESENKAERISDEEIIEPKESQSVEETKNPDDASQPIEDKMETAILGAPLVEKEMVNKEIIPSEEHGKIVEEEETKLETEEQGGQANTEATNVAEGTTVIDKEQDTQISEKGQETDTVNPAKISLFDMMQMSTRVTKVDLDMAAEDKQEKETITADETKAGAEKEKLDGEKEDKEEGEEHDDNEEQHKNDSGSDGLVIVEAASKETETAAVKVVSPKKKSHSILSEVGSKVKHSISKVKKVITGKSTSSNHTKQNSS